MRRTASDFSRTIRRYSVGGQVSEAIIMVRRAIVSQDARVSSIIFGARETGGKSFDCLVLRRFTTASLRSHPLGSHRQTKAVHDAAAFGDGTYVHDRPSASVAMIT